MKKIYECDDILDLRTINFWVFIHKKIKRCINGKCDIFYNSIERVVFIKMYFPKVNLCYTFTISIIPKFESKDIIKMIFQSLRVNIFTEFFNDNLYDEIGGDIND